MPCHPECRSEPRQHSEDKSRACPELTPSVSEGESNGDLVCLAASPNAVLAKYVLLAAIVLLTTAARSDCIAVPEAKKHIGEVKCVAGVVVRVKQGARGVHFLDFCDDFRLCPFTVVIFPRDLKSVGDVRQLQGRMVEIHGQVKEYDGRAEIIRRIPAIGRGRSQNPPAAQELRRGEKRPLQRRNLQPSKIQAQDLETTTSGSGDPSAGRSRAVAK